MRELRVAGFDDAQSLRRLGCTAVALKELGFTAKEVGAADKCSSSVVLYQRLTHRNEM